MRIILKPAGAILVAGALTLVGVVAVRTLGTSAPNAAPVGKPAGVDPIEARPGIGVVTDPGEVSEKGMLAAWNRSADQARDWLFLGPLTSGETITDKANNQDAQAKMSRIINKAYLPNEAKYTAREGASFKLFGKDYTWKKIRGSAFDFKDIYATPELPLDKLKDMVVYGVAHIQSEKAQDRVVQFRSDDGAIVWLNGKQVYKNTAIRGVTVEEKITLPLNAGKNTVLVKVGQGDGGWGLLFHFEDLTGLK
jgi:hypothetical protein